MIPGSRAKCLVCKVRGDKHCKPCVDASEFVSISEPAVVWIDAGRPGATMQSVIAKQGEI
jgi:hypothetical protein